MITILVKKSKIKHILLTLIISITLTSVATTIYAANAEQIKDIAKEFICNCGCNKLLPDCDMSCGISLKKKIGEKIDAGWSKTKIINFMKNNYGNQLLAAPEAKGSGLTAWITPFVALLIGAVVLYFIITSWAKSKKVEPASGEAITSIKDDKTKRKDKGEIDKYEKKIDEELKNFDW